MSTGAALPSSPPLSAPPVLVRRALSASLALGLLAWCVGSCPRLVAAQAAVVEPAPGTGSSPGGGGAGSARPLAAELSSITGPVRVGRPMPTTWDVQNFTGRILEGRFLFRVSYQGCEFYTWETDELVIHETSQRLNLLFPPIVYPVLIPEVQIGVTWRPNSGPEVTLAEQLLRIPTTAPVTALMASVSLGRKQLDDANGAAISWREVQDSVRPERWVGATARGQNQPRPVVQTVFTTLDERSFPTDPYGLLAYDMVLVEGWSFGKLRRGQLEALLSWIAAGGRAIIEVGDAVDTPQREFLAKLTQTNDPSVVWISESVGRVAWPGATESTIFRCRWGVGRAVVSSTAGRARLTDWGQAEFLWGLSPSRHSQMMRGELSARAAGDTSLWTPYLPLPAPLPAVRANELATALSPSSIRPISGPALLTILVALVIWVGPLEGWLLARWKLRRWTWITWPAATFLVTALVISWANASLRAAGEPRSVVIHDYGLDGEWARSNTFTVILPAAADRVREERQRSLWLPLPLPSKLVSGSATNPVTRVTVQNKAYVARSDEPRPRYHGRIPQRYVVERVEEQWTPTLSRQLSLTAPEGGGSWPAEFPLERIPAFRQSRPPTQTTADSDSATLRAVDHAATVALTDVERQQLRAAFGPQAGCFVTVNPGVTSALLSTNPVGILEGQPDAFPQARESEWLSLLAPWTAPALGTTTLSSLIQTSPGNAGGFDLPLVRWEPETPVSNSQALPEPIVMVLVPEQNVLHVHRRVLRAWPHNTAGR